MPEQARGSKWSLLVLRGADRMRSSSTYRDARSQPRQRAVILPVSGCIAALQIRSAYRLHLAKKTIVGQPAYYHLQRIEAERNETIARGEQIGLTGSSGRSMGAASAFPDHAGR